MHFGFSFRFIFFQTVQKTESQVCISKNNDFYSAGVLSNFLSVVDLMEHVNSLLVKLSCGSGDWRRAGRPD